MREKELVPVRPPKAKESARANTHMEARRTSNFELQKKIRELRQRERDQGLNVHEKELLESFIHDLSQSMILEESGYAKVTDELREEVRQEILEITNPENALKVDSLSFEKTLKAEEVLRIYAVAEQILGYREARRDEMQQALVKTLIREFRRNTEEVNAWVTAAVKKIKMQREESADEIAKYQANKG